MHTQTAAATVPIELIPPDIEPWRHSASGVDFVHVFDSGVAGPTVMVQALTHGNELCGAIALDALMREGFGPLHGRLILSFANVEAFARFDPADPSKSRCIDEDLNRVWSDEQLFGPRDSLELRRARALPTQGLWRAPLAGRRPGVAPRARPVSGGMPASAAVRSCRLCPGRTQACGNNLPAPPR